MKPRRPRHYSPQLDRFLVCALYHEAKRRRKPMTRLATEIVTAALRETEGWREAERDARHDDANR